MRTTERQTPSPRQSRTDLRSFRPTSVTQAGSAPAVMNSRSLAFWQTHALASHAVPGQDHPYKSLQTETSLLTVHANKEEGNVG